MVSASALGGGNERVGAFERRRARMEEAAVDMLERILRRRRWSANDKDRIADFLDRLVGDEIMRERLRAGQGGTDE